MRIPSRPRWPGPCDRDASNGDAERARERERETRSRSARPRVAYKAFSIGRRLGLGARHREVRRGTTAPRRDRESRFVTHRVCRDERAKYRAKRADSPTAMPCSSIFVARESSESRNRRHSVISTVHTLGFHRAGLRASSVDIGGRVPRSCSVLWVRLPSAVGRLPWLACRLLALHGSRFSFAPAAAATRNRSLCLSRTPISRDSSQVGYICCTLLDAIPPATRSKRRGRERCHVLSHAKGKPLEVERVKGPPLRCQLPAIGAGRTERPRGPRSRRSAGSEPSRVGAGRSGGGVRGGVESAKKPGG